MRTEPFFAGALGFAMLTLCHAATPESDPLGKHVEAPRQVRVMAEFIELPHVELTRLLLSPRKNGNDTVLRGEIAKLIEAGKARVAETLLCTSPSGNKATAESAQEFIYPTEYEPSSVPAGTDGQKVDPTAPDQATGPTPTAFDSRNLGSNFKIEPTLSQDQKLIDLLRTADIVHHIRDQVWSEWKGDRGDASLKMPVFYRLSVDTSLTLADGQVTLVAALSPNDAEGVLDANRKIMVFVRCDVLEVGR